MDACGWPSGEGPLGQVVFLPVPTVAVRPWVLPPFLVAEEEDAQFQGSVDAAAARKTRLSTPCSTVHGSSNVGPWLCSSVAGALVPATWPICCVRVCMCIVCVPMEDLAAVFTHGLHRIGKEHPLADASGRPENDRKRRPRMFT